MAHRGDLDLVKEATSTTGTGTLTLAGAITGFVGVCDATNGLLADGDTGHFVARNGTEWEMFLGTRGGGGTTPAAFHTHRCTSIPPIARLGRPLLKRITQC